MSYLQFNFESQYLKSNTNIGIILPDRPNKMDAEAFYSNGRKYKVLWLLHGTYGDYSDWLRKSMIELYATEKNLICVMPSAANSDYVSWPGFGLGYDMEAHLIKELMPMIHNWFPASSRKEDNFIAGLSMGGRGVLSYILNYPELFAAGAVLSACPVSMDQYDFEGNRPECHYSVHDVRFKNRVANAGGKEAFLQKNDFYPVIYKMAEEGRLPRLIMGCGDKDRIYYRDFLTFKKNCEQRNIPITLKLYEGYGHEWRFWDLFIQEALKFFGL